MGAMPQPLACAHQKGFARPEQSSVKKNACPLCFHRMHAYTTGFVTHPFGFCDCI